MKEREVVSVVVADDEEDGSVDDGISSQGCKSCQSVSWAYHRRERQPQRITGGRGTA